MNLLVLTYHYFYDDRPYGIKEEDHAFSVQASLFDDHCRQLAESDIDIVDPTRIEDGMWPSDEAEKQVLITIDDGHQSVEDLAVNIMLKYGIPAVLPVIAGRIGEKHYLSWSSLRDLATKGFSIQSHSMTHANLSRMTEDQCRDELRRSKETIEDNIGAPVVMLAAPMGRINRQVIDCAGQIGYSIIMTSFTGINAEVTELKSLKRFQVKGHMKRLPLDEYFSPFSSVRLIGSAKNMAKRLRDGLR